MNKFLTEVLNSVKLQLCGYVVMSKEHGKKHYCHTFKDALEWMACYDCEVRIIQYSLFSGIKFIVSRSGD